MENKLEIFNKDFEKFSLFYITHDSDEIFKSIGEINDIIRDNYVFFGHENEISKHKQYNINISNNNCYDMSKNIKDNIDYVFISKNIKKLEYIFKNYILSTNIEMSYDMFLEYLEKYNHLIIDCFEKKVYRYLTKNEAARIIQKGCHNWLYSPKCKDGTVGIVPRLGYKCTF